MKVRDAIMNAGLDVFDREGFDRATVAGIRGAAGVSNGSFFHAFGSKDELAAELFLTAMRAYHVAMLAPLKDRPDAPEGVTALVAAHLSWVVNSRRQARLMFEQARADWIVHIRDAQAQENSAFGQRIGAWRDPLVATGALRPLPAPVFYSLVIGPAQIFCRGWLSGRDAADPRERLSDLADCAVRALVA